MEVVTTGLPFSILPTWWVRWEEHGTERWFKHTAQNMVELPSCPNAIKTQMGKSQARKIIYSLTKPTKTGLIRAQQWWALKAERAGDRREAAAQELEEGQGWSKIRGLGRGQRGLWQGKHPLFLPL